MATIKGTEKADTLHGTAGNDDIQALGGNDRIIGSTGYDNIDGGAGHDTIDFSGIDRDLVLNTDNTIGSGVSAGPVPPPADFFRSTLKNIETIIGNPHRTNNIGNFGRYPQRIHFNVDLPKNLVTFINPVTNISTAFNVKNFNNVDNTNFGNNRVVGNNFDNYIFVGAESTGMLDANGIAIRIGNNTIIGSKGNDTLSADPTGTNNTLDYSNLGRGVKFMPPGKIDKGNFGKDKINGFQKIIGATNKVNTIDASTADNGSSLNVNLAHNSLALNIPGSTPEQFEVINFVDVIGSKNNDTIVGANKNSKLTGGGGNDTITGGNKNDRITGTDSTARGVGEHDILTGGGGKDRFILGDKNGAYYVGKGNDDYATITDFDLFKDSISIGNCNSYSFALEGTNTIDLYSGKDVNHRDLIAKIQITGGISSVSRNSKSIVGSSSSMDAIVAKMDIFSGAESEHHS
jgi:Ca2+-binding RTX toxin-like protein